MDYLHKIEAIIILDTQNGRRLFTKYYPVMRAPAPTGASKAPAVAQQISNLVAGPWPTLAAQQELERTLFEKTCKVHAGKVHDGDILLFDGHTFLFRVDPEVTYIIAGGPDENEIMLYSALLGLCESIQQVVKTNNAVDKRTFLEHYDAVILIVDELVDDSVVLETSSGLIFAEVQSFTEQDASDGAKKALSTLNKYLKNF